MRVRQGECRVCAESFRPQFRFQIQEHQGEFVLLCSQECNQKWLRGDAGVKCESCSNNFVVEYPFQVSLTLEGKRYFCSTKCRDERRANRRSSRRIAVFNHKGGTGKTTTAVSLAVGLARKGEKVLLIDADGQGNVGASLGISGDRNLYHVLTQGISLRQAVVPVDSNLDVLTSNETLAAAELRLATLSQRHRVLRDRLADGVGDYDTVVVDCAPALSLMNQNALVFADSLLIPVACDYLSLVGVKQVLRTVKHVRSNFKHAVKILGVIPTFYDARNRTCRDALEAVREHFGDRCAPVVRQNAKIREAPSVRTDVFTHAPKSRGAEDYAALVDWVIEKKTKAQRARKDASWQRAV